MAYAVHINPNATLGDEAAVEALFAEDTDNVGILDTNAGTEHRTQTDSERVSKLTLADTTGEAKTATGASLPNAIQDRLIRAFCGADRRTHRVPPPPSLPTRRGVSSSPTTEVSQRNKSGEILAAWALRNRSSLEVGSLPMLVAQT